jgi:hypothetical protein
MKPRQPESPVREIAMLDPWLVSLREATPGANSDRMTFLGDERSLVNDAEGLFFQKGPVSLRVWFPGLDPVSVTRPTAACRGQV